MKVFTFHERRYWRLKRRAPHEIAVEAACTSFVISLGISSRYGDQAAATQGRKSACGSVIVSSRRARTNSGGTTWTIDAIWENIPRRLFDADDVSTLANCASVDGSTFTPVDFERCR